MIDLHLHTTASDGRLTPEELVREAAAAGLTTIAVTDHDTIQALPAVDDAARLAGLDAISGIEITAVHDGHDVHVLGYFFDRADATLSEFLERQRADRRRRTAEMLNRLNGLGVFIDPGPLLADAEANPGKAVGRPLIAAALVESGHAPDIAAAFDLFLAEGRPAFVERRGAPPNDVVGLIHRAGGIASLAHPGKQGLDHLIVPMIEAGLSAIEIYHPDHSDADVRRYQDLAQRFNLVATGGSDYHGPGSGRVFGFGRTCLPQVDYDRLRARRAIESRGT